MYLLISTNLHKKHVEFVRGGYYKYLTSRSMWQGNIVLIKTFFNSNISFMKKDCQENAFSVAKAEGLPFLKLDLLVTLLSRI